MRSVFVGSGVYPLLLHVGLGALRHQIVSDRRREEDRGGRTYDHADDQREDEAADRLAAEEEDGQQRHERRARGVDRTRQRRVDGVVHGLLQVALRVETQVLADSVEDDHRVVDGIADDRQDRGDERLVDLEVEGQQTVEHREDADDQQGERKLE